MIEGVGMDSGEPEGRAAGVGDGRVERGIGKRRRYWPGGGRDILLVFFAFLHLYTSYAPGPHNKANLCCTTYHPTSGGIGATYVSTDRPTYVPLNRRGEACGLVERG